MQGRGAEADYVHGLQACWRSVAEIYLRVLAMPQGQVHPDLVEQQIDTVVDAMKRLGLVFPISSAFLPSSLLLSAV